MRSILAPYTRIVLLCLLAAAAPFAHAGARSVKATYAASMNGMSIGTITEQFESDGSAYRIVSDTRPMGLAALIQRHPLRFSSSGQVGRGGLQPTLFEARRAATDAPQVSARLDWSTRQIVLRHNGKTESLSLPSGTQDRLSVMYQFTYLSVEQLAQLEFPMTNGRKLDRYRYRLAGEVEIDTGIGRLKTLHLVRQRDPGDTAHEVWLSSLHQHFPVKLLIVERDGMRLEQVIQNLELRD